MRKNRCNYIFLIILICILLFQATAYAAAGGVYVACDADGNPATTKFSKAEVDLKDVDKIDNFTYSGADVAIFKRPTSGDDYEMINVTRIFTNSPMLSIQDFGDNSKFDEISTYCIGYKPIYRPAGVNDFSTLIEDKWNMLEDSYFKALPPVQFDVSQFTDRVTGINKSYTDEQAARLNYYFPKSEVVSMFEIKPQHSSQTEKYHIVFNSNVENSELQTYDLKLAAVQIGVNKKLISLASNVEVNGNNIEFDVAPQTGNEDKNIKIYCKYKFKKRISNQKLINKFIKNTVSVTSSSGTDSAQDIQNNKIRILDVKILYK
jgi:hypothetical protein